VYRRQSQLKLLSFCCDIYSGRCITLSMQYKTLLNTKIMSWAAILRSSTPLEGDSDAPCPPRENDAILRKVFMCNASQEPVCWLFSSFNKRAYTRTHKQLPRTHKHAHSLIHTHTHSHFLSRTHTHSHTLSLSLAHVELSSRTIMSVYACISLSVRIFLRMCVFVCVCV